MASRSALFARTVFVFLTLGANCQSRPSISQKSDHSSCSNIVALAGDVHVDCSELTPEQKKTLQMIPAMLNRILSNQDPAAIMSKLNQILQLASRSSGVDQRNSGGINVQQATAGNNSSIIDSPITIGELPKTITEVQRKCVNDLLTSATKKSTIWLRADQYSAAPPFTRELYDLFKNAGWPMTTSGVQTYMNMGGAVNPVKVTIIEAGGPRPEGYVGIPDSDPIAVVSQALRSLGLDPHVGEDSTLAQGTLIIRFEGQFVQ